MYSSFIFFNCNKNWNATRIEIRYAYIKAVFFGAKNETFKFPHVRFIGIHNVCGQGLDQVK